MANYLLVARHRDVHARVADVLREITAGAPSEVLHVSADPSWELTWVATDAAADALDGGRGLFAGYAVDDGERAFYFGSPGWGDREPAERAGDDLPGCYASVEWDTAALTVSTDLFGCMPLFMSAEPGLLMVSDAPYVLLRMRRRAGLPVTADPEVAQAHVLGNAITAQLAGRRTFAREIEFLPVGRRVALPLGPVPARAEVAVRPLRSLFPADGSDGYARTLRAAAVDVASVIRTIATWGPESARLGLSGGTDSRICLAAALLTPEPRAGALFSCTNRGPHNQRDIEVVRELAQAFGFPLGRRGGAGEPPPELRREPEPLRLWASDQCLGYFPLRMQSQALRRKGMFAITGHGSELYKGNYGMRSVRQVVESVRRTLPGTADAFHAVAEDFLVESGIGLDEDFSAEWHYLATRNALHAGRATPMSKFSLRPLQQRPLVGLSKVPASDRPSGMTHPRQISQDLLVVLSPSLATQPFDRPGKDLAYSEVLDRLRLLGGPLAADETCVYTAHGDVEDVSEGPARALSALVDPQRFTGPIERTTVLPLLEEAVAVVRDQEWSRLLGDLPARALQRAQDPSAPVADARGDAGKVISLAEVVR